MAEEGRQGEEEGKERKGRGKKNFRLIFYEVKQNCESPGGQSHRPLALFDEIRLKFAVQQLGGQGGQFEEKGGRELVSCSLKLTTLFWGMVLVCVRVVRQLYFSQV